MSAILPTRQNRVGNRDKVCCGRNAKDYSQSVKKKQTFCSKNKRFNPVYSKKTIMQNVFLFFC